MARKRPGKKRGRRTRVDFRRNRQKPARQKTWEVPGEDNELAEDTVSRETVRAKGDLSRRRTVVEPVDSGADDEDTLRQGTVVAVRGQFVDVSDGERTWPCTVRRILRTRLISERHPVVVGDQVAFSVVADKEGVLSEGVIERVSDRRTWLTRCDHRRSHLIAANMDQMLIVSSIREPIIKPHLIDRYLVAASAGNVPAAVCVNKVDLDEEDDVAFYLERYRQIGYAALGTSAERGDGIDELRSMLTGKVTLLAGQSGVGKSSLINAIEPGLNLKTGHVSTSTEKGRHTTTTALWLELPGGGAVLDTPGIKALDVAMVPLNELEMHFVEFVDRVADCKFPDCVHIHEDGCAIKDAVEAGEIDPARYDSYVQLFADLSDLKSH